jgi:hypothetical protein
MKGSERHRSAEKRVETVLLILYKRGEGGFL